MSGPQDLPHPLVGGPFSSPVGPGTGWPDDPAAPDTPVARDATECAPALTPGMSARNQVHANGLAGFSSFAAIHAP